MICTRSLAVTLKKAGISQRAIDSSLLRFDPVTQQVKISSIYLLFISVSDLLSPS